MDWQPTIIAGLICLLLPTQISFAKAWSLPSRHSNQLALNTAPVGRRLNGKTAPALQSNELTLRLSRSSRKFLCIFFFVSNITSNDQADKETKHKQRPLVKYFYCSEILVH